MFIAQRQGFTIEAKARRNRRQRRDRIAHAAEFNAQAGAGSRPGAAGEGHDQAVMQPDVAGHAEVLIVAGYLPVIEELLCRRRPHQRRRQ